MAFRLRIVQTTLILILIGVCTPALSADDWNETQKQWKCSAVQGEWICALEDSGKPPYQLPPSRRDQISASNEVGSEQYRAEQKLVLDWVEKSQLSEEQQALCARGCNGDYVEPVRENQDADADPNDAEIRGEADTTQIDVESREALLEGDVVFTQGRRQVMADRAVINQAESEYSINGKVSIREPGILLIGDSASVNGKDNSMVIDNATYLMHAQRLRGSAETIYRDGASELVIEDATYTSCEPGRDAWILSAEKLSLNDETGRAEGRNVVVRTAGIPILYLPYLNFPIDDRRQSGILYPSLELSSDDGFDYEQPIFWNMADNQDMTFSPRIIEDRGFGLGLEHRYLTHEGLTESAAVFFPDDQAEDRDGRYNGDSRWSLNLDHNGYVKGLWTELDFARVSDVDYFEDYGASFIDEASESSLRQFGRVSYQEGNWQISLLAENFQTLAIENSDQYLRLPELDIKGYGNYGRDLWWKLDYQYSRFDHSRDSVADASGFQQGEDGTWITGLRLRSELRTGWRSESEWYHIEPAIGLDYLYYNLDSALVGQTLSNPSEVAPNFSFDAGLAFERNVTLFGKRWLQTLDPRLFYQYRDASDQGDMPVFDSTVATRSYDQLFRRNEFVGGDRLSDSNQLTFGLSSSLFDADSGRELARLRVAQAYYLSDRSVHLNPSILAGLTSPDSVNLDPTLVNAAIVGEQAVNELEYNRSELIVTLNLNVSQNWSTNGELIWDDVASDVDRLQMQLRYASPDDGKSLSLSYFREKDVFYLRDSNGDGLSALDELLAEDVEQGSITASFDWRENWSIDSRWQYDLANRRRLDSILGITYENCCWNASLTWRRWLERDDVGIIAADSLGYERGIFIGFEWVGLGGIGKTSREILRSGRIQ